ncbi:arylformamidase [Malikia sp.]|uniref:arylformamidase n=1 Tax=Malikia sp. TaxID=2070706 RepID=UPI00263351AA|nr:arylformamidase [Malikia sp.]MDD2729360.1 arylformamidase [Malikia sp.]
MSRIWDISPPVAASSPVYPGDAPYRREWQSRIGPDCAVNLSAITLTPHVGAHADAPLHYDTAGQSAGGMDLAPFIGHCRVIHAIGCGPRVRWRDLAHALPADQAIPARILIRTYRRQPRQWDPDLAGIAPEAIERLAGLGVRLIGIDSASIDPADSVALESHQALRRGDLRVLENLCLDAVAEGDYELIALPLKLMDCEASPVRAVLRPFTDGPPLAMPR